MDNKPNHLVNSAGQRTALAEGTCVFCGYNLRGLGVDGHCPECGQPVAASLRAKNLADAPLEWRRGVVAGAMWLVWGLWILAMLRGVSIYQHLRAAAFPTWPAYHLGEPWWSLAVVATDLIQVIGIWKLTRSDPCITDLRGAAGRVRFFAGADVAIALISLTCMGGLARIDRSLLGLFGSGAALMSVWLLYRYIATLARRIPNPDLASRFVAISRIYPWAILAGSGLAHLLYLIHWPPFRLRLMLPLAGMILTLCLGICAIVMLARFAKEIGALPARGAESC